MKIENKKNQLQENQRGLIRNRRGFTLLEIMVVIVILGMLSALVGPKVLDNIQKAKVSTTRTQIDMLGSALDNFLLDNNRYPTTDEGLNALRENPGEMDKWDGPYLTKAVPKDGWDNEYHYRSPGEHGKYDLFSYGEDNAEGGEGKRDKDIVSWE